MRCLQSLIQNRSFKAIHKLSKVDTGGWHGVRLRGVVEIQVRDFLGEGEIAGKQDWSISRHYYGLFHEVFELSYIPRPRIPAQMLNSFV